MSSAVILRLHAVVRKHDRLKGRNIAQNPTCYNSFKYMIYVLNLTPLSSFLNTWLLWLRMWNSMTKLRYPSTKTQNVVKWSIDILRQRTYPIYFMNPKSDLNSTFVLLLYAISRNIVEKFCALLGRGEGNPPVNHGFSSQRASNMESLSTSLRHHGICTALQSIIQVTSRFVEYQIRRNNCSSLWQWQLTGALITLKL